MERKIQEERTSISCTLLNLLEYDMASHFMLTLMNILPFFNVFLVLSLRNIEPKRVDMGSKIEFH